MYFKHVGFGSSGVLLASLVAYEPKKASFEVSEVEEVVQAILDLLVESGLAKDLSVESIEGFVVGEKDLLRVDLLNLGDEDVEILDVGEGEGSLVVGIAGWVYEGIVVDGSEVVLNSGGRVVVDRSVDGVDGRERRQRLLTEESLLDSLMGGLLRSSPLGVVEGIQLCSQLARSAFTGVEGERRLAPVKLEQRGWWLRLGGGRLRSKLSKLGLGHALLFLGRLAGLVLPAWVGKRVLALGLSRLAMELVFDFLAFILPLLANDASCIKLARAL